MALRKREQLNEALSNVDNIQGVEGSAVITRDGLLLSSNHKMNAEAFAAMNAAMFGAAETTFGELKKGKVLRIITEGKDGKLVAMGAGALALVVVLVKNNSDLGQILAELSKGADKVKTLMK